MTSNGNGQIVGDDPPANTRHTYVVYVEDVPGALNRIASLFRRRTYNIESLTVGATEKAGVSRMTIVVECDDTTARLVEANLYKLVNVLRVQDVTYKQTVKRDLALIKVTATAETRPQVLQVVDVFRARVVDIAPAAIVVEITGTEEKIKGLLEVLEPFGIIEFVQTGTIAMTRGADTVSVKPRSNGAARGDSTH